MESCHGACHCGWGMEMDVKVDLVVVSVVEDGAEGCDDIDAGTDTMELPLV